MMASAMLTPDKCKAFAAECRALVPMAASSHQKTILVELADHWDSTAKDMQELERKKAADSDACHRVAHITTNR
jgi:hypothetical protein